MNSGLSTTINHQTLTIAIERANDGRVFVKNEVRDNSADFISGKQEFVSKVINSQGFEVVTVGDQEGAETVDFDAVNELLVDGFFLVGKSAPSRESSDELDGVRDVASKKSAVRGVKSFGVVGGFAGESAVIEATEDVEEESITGTVMSASFSESFVENRDDHLSCLDQQDGHVVMRRLNELALFDFFSFVFSQVLEVFLLTENRLDFVGVAESEFGFGDEVIEDEFGFREVAVAESAETELGNTASVLNGSSRTATATRFSVVATEQQEHFTSSGEIVTKAEIDDDEENCVGLFTRSIVDQNFVQFLDCGADILFESEPTTSRSRGHVGRLTRHEEVVSLGVARSDDL
jgi:hypothetical protein